MDHPHDPADDANEERSITKEGEGSGFIKGIDRAVSGLFKRHPDNDLNPDEQKHLREENDAEQRR